MPKSRKNSIFWCFWGFPPPYQRLIKWGGVRKKDKCLVAPLIQQNLEFWPFVENDDFRHFLTILAKIGQISKKLFSRKNLWIFLCGGDKNIKNRKKMEIKHHNGKLYRAQTENSRT